MYVHSVKLVNYKSFGDYPENEVILEPQITAIVGKNESGKSNVLDGLSNISFFSPKTSAFDIKDVNRNIATNSRIQYHIVLKPDKQDKEIGIEEDTYIDISQEQAIVSGGFFSFYLKKYYEEFDALAKFMETVGKNPFKLRDAEYTSYRGCLDELMDSSKLDLYARKRTIHFFYSRVNSYPDATRQVFTRALDGVRQCWHEYSDLLPTFFLRRTDKHLNTTYKVENIEKEIRSSSANPSSLLYEFVKLIEIPADDFLLAVKSSTESRGRTLRMKIQRQVDEKINKPFKRFYRTEEVSLQVDILPNSVSFLVLTNAGESLMLSERSNGLKWYLEMFIDSQANDIPGRNVVYLLDEPGISLHVNAQRELLGFFQELASRGNQVVYTTHSPYMLDTTQNGIHRIRAVVKNNEGFSFIYKSAYDARIAPESQQDTLAPIISALGMSLTDTFGPAKDRLNIVTEGMSDYIFIDTFAKLLGLDRNKYAIIPSVGATNCVNICTILHGWGCPYKAVFDYDKEGVESGGEYMREKMLLEYGKHYCYVTEVDKEEISSKTYKNTPVMIEDTVGRSEIDRFITESGNSANLGKTLTAKVMCTAIEKGSFQVSQECMDRMKILLNRIAPDMYS